MSRPVPMHVMHFTRVEHLATIVESGLLSDSRARREGLLTVEVGNTEIKGRRAKRLVPIPPGGNVADYVPFYFAGRSPMMYSIHMGNVQTYRHGIDRLVYLVTTLERLQELGLRVLLTDRNAVLDLAEFWSLADGEPEEGFIDWPLMQARYWFATEEYPDRLERRMAECLVHDRLPFDAFTLVVAKSQIVAKEAVEVLEDAGSQVPVVVRPGWYF